MRYERALEVLVVVLLGAAGIAVAVATYEGNRHHSAALWWALAVGCFAFAVLIPTVWLGVHPLFVWGSGKTAEWRIAAAARAVEQDQRMAALRAASAPEPAPFVDEDEAVIAILSATYAGPNNSADVTAAVRDLRTDGGRRLAFTVDNHTLGGPDFDPDYGHGKVLTIRYLLAGSEQTISVNEGHQVNLP